MIPHSPRVPDYESLRAIAKKIPSLDPDDVRAALLLKSVASELTAYLQQSLEQYGISEGRMRVLGYLLEQDKPASHSELAEATGVTKGTVTGLIDGLESDGHVRRVACCHDRRVSFIEMTKKGEKMLQRIMPGHLGRLSELMDGLSKAERKQLIQLLDKARSGLRPEGESRPQGKNQ